MLASTDATLSRAGVVTAEVSACSAEQAVAIWGRQKWHRVGLKFQGVGDDPTLPMFEVARPTLQDVPLERALQTLQFKEICRYRFRENRHINYQKLIVWRTGIKHFSRDLKYHNCRLLSLLDSQVVCYSVRKGRSTSCGLNALLQSVVGTCLLSKIEVLPLWIASKANPADDPTRIPEVRRALPNDHATTAFWDSAQRWSWPLTATH
eukprot:2952700-Amphidinium_carterae.2